MSALLLTLLGCAPAGPLPPAAVTRDVLAVAPPATEMLAVRHAVAGPLEVPPVPLRIRWGPPRAEAGRLVFEVTTEEARGGDLRVIEVARHFYGRDGFGYLGTVDREGAYQAWDVPQIVLPRRPRSGQSWSAVHVKAGVASRRSCEIGRSERCDGGLVAVCDSRRAEARVVTRDHFCPGWGWLGAEALVQRPDRTTVRERIDVIQVDGRRVPDDAGPPTDRDQDVPRSGDELPP